MINFERSIRVCRHLAPLVFLIGSVTAQAQAPASQQRVVPGMAAYTNEVLYGDVWERVQLSARDRALVTITTLIAIDRPEQLRTHLGNGLTNGITPLEASGVLTHLAVYAGWPHAVTALAVYNEVFSARNIDTDVLAAAMEPLPPVPSATAINQSVDGLFADIAPKFAELTNEFVFDDLWRRPDLSHRDRSLVTITTLAAMGDTALLDTHLRMGVEHGLTRDEIVEAMTHLAFYAGWSRATLAMREVSAVLGEGR